jgi:hypothetical protein
MHQPDAMAITRSSLPRVQRQYSDWANDESTRRSTSGGIIFHGDHILCHWAKTQSTIALSSGEAELNGLVKAISEVIGVFELLAEIYTPKKIIINTDASAARGMLLRRGSGKVKHLTAKQLWVQEIVKSYSVDIIKIDRKVNWADVLTHTCSSGDFLDAMLGIGLVFRAVSSSALSSLREDKSEEGCEWDNILTYKRQDI